MICPFREPGRRYTEAADAYNRGLVAAAAIRTPGGR